MSALPSSDKFTVCKRNGRLFVIEGTQVVYSPPEFLRGRITERGQLQSLADQLNAGVDYIEAIRAFELSLRPDAVDPFKSPSMDDFLKFLKDPTK